MHISKKRILKEMINILMNNFHRNKNNRIMMYDKIIMYLLLLSAVLLCSCQISRQKPLDIDFHKGVSGIELELAGFLPEMYENSFLEANILIYNKGAYDINDEADAYLNLGLEKDYMCIFDAGSDNKCTQDENLYTANFALHGRSILNPAGDFAQKVFPVWIKALEPQSQLHDSLITATACYKYRTELTTEACIDPHFYDLAPVPKPCEVHDLAFDSQGAPVAIYSLEVKMLAEGEKRIKPHFIIHMRDMGNGEVVNMDKIGEVCRGEELESRSFNIAHLNTVEFSGGAFKYERGKDDSNTIECFPRDGVIRFREKDAVIRCTAKVPLDRKDSAFVTQVRIVADYGYTSTVSKQIKIKNAEGY